MRPEDITFMDVKSDSVIIQWTVPYISYSPETYVVQYGTSRDSLIHNSSSTHSEEDVINPRRACARVTVVVLCVCLSVYPSVPALAASASVETSKQRYSRVSLRLFLDFDSWIFEKTFREKVMARKSQYANELELTVSRFRAVSGQTKRSSYVKGNWWVE